MIRDDLMRNGMIRDGMIRDGAIWNGMSQSATTPAADGLVLRDIHVAAAPPWWPPAPGWWLLAVALLAAAAAFAWWRARRGRRRAAIARLFDDAIARADTPAARIAAISELLRRAARRRDPQADRLQGEDWLRFLDQGAPQAAFAADFGTLLRDGAWRREAPEGEVERLRLAARARFLDWMERRR